MREVLGEAHVIVRAEAEDDLRVHVAASQAIIFEVDDGARDGG